MGRDVDTPGRADDEQWRCAQCADLIGAYEPVVTIEDGQARLTSRRAELRTGRRPSEHYHEACYLLEHHRLDAQQAHVADIE